MVWHEDFCRLIGKMPEEHLNMESLGFLMNFSSFPLATEPLFRPCSNVVRYDRQRTVVCLFVKSTMLEKRAQDRRNEEPMCLLMLRNTAKTMMHFLPSPFGHISKISSLDLDAAELLLSICRRWPTSPKIPCYPCVSPLLRRAGMHVPRNLPPSYHDRALPINPQRRILI